MGPRQACLLAGQQISPLPILVQVNDEIVLALKDEKVEDVARIDEISRILLQGIVLVPLANLAFYMKWDL
jgi:hypothetical protein